ncbi:MAG: HD family phosphohydrolase, partial [Oscillospiraceae bacterium]|nr:HD family phosphohydrolase [Oscillospiraceae bacterium]
MGNLSNAYKRSFSLDKNIEEEFFQCIDDLINLKEVQILAQYEQHVDVDRLQHVLSVAYLSFLACKKLDLSYKSASRGAILHDLFYYDWRSKDDNSHRLHGYRHPGFALQNARKIASLSKLEENIIKRHMWPLTVIPPRYAESFIVSMADKYCATREILNSFAGKYK